MTPPDRPYLQLRTPAVICAVLLAGGIGVAFSSHQLLNIAEERTRAAARSLAQTEHALLEAEQTANQTREALTRHAKLLSTGISRPADRVAWIEHLESLRRSPSITQLNYEISPEHQLMPAEAGTDERPVLLAHTPHMRASVPHEDAFLELMNRLGKADTPLRPTRCQLSRLDEAGKKGSLNVHCDVDWIHLRLTTP